MGGRLIRDDLKMNIILLLHLNRNKTNTDNKKLRNSCFEYLETYENSMKRTKETKRRKPNSYSTQKIIRQ